MPAKKKTEIPKEKTLRVSDHPPDEAKEKKPAVKAAAAKKAAASKTAAKPAAPKKTAAKPAAPKKAAAEPVAADPVPDPEPAPVPEDTTPKYFILHAASEAQPFIKTGGLADVLGSLPKEQARQGNQVAVIIPKYKDIPNHFVEKMEYLTNFTVQLGWRTQYCGVFRLKEEDVTYYFVDNEFYFGFPGVYTDGGNFEAERFSFFCRAVLEIMGRLNIYPDVLHCHDWQTGMIPFLLRTQYSFNPAYARIRCAYTIHNLKFQGVFSWPLIEGILFVDYQYNSPQFLEFNGAASFMKGGIIFSDIITTVSPTYAREIQTEFFGEQLDGLLRSRNNVLYGVVNGVDMDEWSSEKDNLIPAHFTADDLAGKAVCKKNLQHEMWLNEREDVPLIGIVSRLTSQKGFDLIRHILPELMDHQDVQFAILGTGESQYEEFFKWASSAYPGRIAAHIELNYPLSHRIYAGCDFFLMPSLFEPCGLSQIMSMRYGTLPIVRKTGGLADTVEPYNEYEVKGTGFAFDNYNAHEMMHIIEYALTVYRERPEHMKALIRQAMTRDFSWTQSAKRYSELYASIDR